MCGQPMQAEALAVFAGPGKLAETGSLTVGLTRDPLLGVKVKVTLAMPPGTVCTMIDLPVPLAQSVLIMLTGTP